MANKSFVCLFVLEFYGPANNEVMSSRSVNSGTVARIRDILFHTEI